MLDRVIKELAERDPDISDVATYRMNKYQRNQGSTQKNQPCTLDVCRAFFMRLNVGARRIAHVASSTTAGLSGIA